MFMPIKEKEKKIKIFFDERIVLLSGDESELLKRIHDYDEITFRHSVNVATIVCRELNKYQYISEHEKSEWVKAALLHDIGKLSTREDILKGGDLANDAIKHKEMMMHSLRSAEIYSGKNVSRHVKIASLTHHIHYDYLNDWENAWMSKNKPGRPNPWEPEKYQIEKTLNKEIGTLSDKEIRITALISFADQVEAMRAGYRNYKDAFDWEKIERILDEENKYHNTLCITDKKSLYDQDFKNFVDVVTEKENTFYKNVIDQINNGSLSEFTPKKCNSKSEIEIDDYEELAL